MKNLGGKFKNVDFKSFFVHHGEKLGVAAVVAIVGAVLFMTEWSSFEQVPTDLEQKVETANNRITTSEWPEEKRAEVATKDFLEQAEDMLTPLNIDRFEYRTTYFDPLVKPQQLITATNFLGVEQLIADQGAFLMELNEDPADLFAAEQYPNAGKQVNTEETTEDIDLAWKRRNEVFGVRNTGGGRNFNSRRGDDDDDDDDRFGLGNQRGRYAGGGRLGNRAGGGRVRANSRRGDDDDGRSRRAGGRSVGGGLDGGGFDAGPARRARGQRYAAIRGLFDLRQQRLELMKSLRLSLPSEADKFLQFRGFRIQRQRAVAGPEPWKEENWEELDIDEAVRVLADAAGFALPILDPRVTNPYITMPLPPRLQGYWTDHATHPQLEQFKLSDEEREQFEQVVALLKQQEEEQQQYYEQQSGGFIGIMEDITKIQQRQTEEQLKKLRQQVDQSPTTVDDRVKEMFGLTEPDLNAGYGAGYPGQRGVRGRGAGMRGGSVRGGGRGLNIGGFGNSRGDDDDDDGGRGGRFGRGRRGGRGGLVSRRGALPSYEDQQNFSGIEAAIGRVLLFRYLDFTVKPGEAYRYRVKLVFNNPAYNLYQREQVDDESVIRGETRESEWSEPTEVVVIPYDTQAFVTQVNKTDEPGRDGVRFELFQWHQDLGTVIHDTLNCGFGEFVGGEENTLVLNLAKPSFDAERATFTSSMVLVDAEEEPVINLADHPDLKAVVANMRGVRTDRETRFGVPAEAVVIREDGSTERLDSMSEVTKRDELEVRLNKIRDQYKDLKDSGDRGSYRDRLEASGRLGDMDDGRGGGDRGSNILRRGRGRRR